LVRYVRQDWLDPVRRGDLVTIALQGEQGKPRPALVVQANSFAGLRGVAVLPITGTLLEAPLLRIEVEPSAQNGLNKRSQIMVDKLQTPPRDKASTVIGHLDPTALLAVDRALALFLGLA